MENKKGFTLTELLAVIAIMGIIAIAAISGYTTMTKNSKNKSLESKISQIENAAIKYSNENNLRSSTTISVNKLVVEGYLQPDEATDSGLASVNNPLTNENMICNLIHVTINDNIFIAEYDTKSKDCSAAEQDATDSNIIINAYKFEEGVMGDSIGYEGGNILNWTKTDVVLVTSSDVYTNVASIRYDFDGNTITKIKEGNPSNSEYNESDYNKLAIEGVRILLNKEVTVTYMMQDGSSYSRTIVVRIDKEEPTARITHNNDLSKSEIPGKIYIDDANGSGVKGYYLFFDYETIEDAVLIPGSFENDITFNSYRDYKLVVEDNAGNRSSDPIDFKPNIAYPEIETNQDPIENPEPTKGFMCDINLFEKETDTIVQERSNHWYNKYLDLQMKSAEKIGRGGASYYFGTKASAKEDQFAKERRYIDTKLTQDTETDGITYYGKMSNLVGDRYECSKEVKVDVHEPVVTFTPNTDETYAKSHTFNIEITDNLSGFTNGNIKYQWSTSTTNPSGTWVDLSGTLSSNKKKITINNFNVNTIGSNLMTGSYYLWIQGDSYKDLATNGNDIHSGVFNFDNIPPVVSSITAATRGTGFNTNSADITITGSDTGGSELSKVCIKLTNDSNGCEWRDIASDNKYPNISTGVSYVNGGTVTFYAWFKDGAGNISQSNSTNYTVYKQCDNANYIINDGNATCGSDYGNCSAECGPSTQYSTYTQKKKDIYTGASCTAYVQAQSPSCPRACSKPACAAPGKPTISGKRTKASIMKAAGATVTSGGWSNGITLTFSGSTAVGGVKYYYKVGSGTYQEGGSYTKSTAGKETVYAKACNATDTSLCSGASDGFVINVDTTAPTIKNIPSAGSGHSIKVYGDLGRICPNHKFVLSGVATYTYESNSMGYDEDGGSGMKRMWLRIIYGDWHNDHGNNYRTYGNWTEEKARQNDWWRNVYGSKEGVEAAFPKGSIQVAAYISRHSGVHIQVTGEDNAGNSNTLTYDPGPGEACTYGPNKNHDLPGTPGYGWVSSVNAFDSISRHTGN